MTFIPVILIGNFKSRRKIRHAALHGVPTSEEKVNKLLKKIRVGTVLLNSLFLVPFTLFWATVFASLEQTPLTGRYVSVSCWFLFCVLRMAFRWRMIILSPDEEDEISAQLVGQGWYRAVDDILAQDGPPKYISSSDWRYAWASETLRKLEATIPILLRESEMCTDWTERGDDDPPMPPPTQYPLTTRPRASETLHRMCEEVCNKRKNPNWKPEPVQNTFVGPPYALLLVDKPDAANAFSYGFGPDGGGGIVVYSGFLDEIFSKYPLQSEAPSVEKNKSWWSLLLGNLLSSTSTPVARPQPTPEQTTELAILLAHELSHLILSHHLESLSSTTIVVPGIFSIASDIVRMLIFPITMIFGPFVNDAVAQLGKVGSGELTKLGLHCTSWKQEIEADVVSARLLAHAGFDAREAVKFWAERAPVGCSSPAKDRQGNSVQRIRGESHPLNEVRVAKFKEELQRWKNERDAVLAQRQRTSS